MKLVVSLRRKSSEPRFKDVYFGIRGEGSRALELRGTDTTSTSDFLGYNQVSIPYPGRGSDISFQIGPRMSNPGDMRALLDQAAHEGIVNYSQEKQLLKVIEAVEQKNSERSMRRNVDEVVPSEDNFKVYMGGKYRTKIPKAFTKSYDFGNYLAVRVYGGTPRRHFVVANPQDVGQYLMSQISSTKEPDLADNASLVPAGSTFVGSYDSGKYLYSNPAVRPGSLQVFRMKEPWD